MFKLFKKNFFNDSDGFSARDLMMLVYMGMHTTFAGTAFYKSLDGSLNPQTLELLNSMDGTIMAIIAGVFTLQSVKEFTNRNKNPEIITEDNRGDTNNSGIPGI